MKLIKFKGKQYLFVGESLDESAPIATKKQYQNGLCSYAHYYPNEGISRFGIKIGECSDIQVLKDVEVKPNLPKAFFNILESPTWPFNI